MDCARYVSDILPLAEIGRYLFKRFHGEVQYVYLTTTNTVATTLILSPSSSRVWSVFHSPCGFLPLVLNSFAEREHEATQDLHKKQSFLVKIGMGLSLFVGLVVLLWFPLFLLSSANPTNKPNYVVTVTIEVGA